MWDKTFQSGQVLPQRHNLTDEERTNGQAEQDRSDGGCSHGINSRILVVKGGDVFPIQEGVQAKGDPRE